MKPLKNPDRFWSKVEVRGPDDCWNWTACKVRGYGVLWHDGNNKRAPRLAYFLAHGEIPSDQVILHSCDNPACVNPAHLSLGTSPENTADRHRKGRDVRGERQHLAKLTDDVVRAIFQDTRSGPEIAAAYGVNRSTVNRIRRGETWRHVTFAPDYLRAAVNSIAGARA